MTPAPPGAPRRRPGASRPVLAVLFLLSAAPGCRTIDGTWGIPPFYEIYDSPSTLMAEGTETYFRPFFAYERTGAEMRRARSLTPFIDLVWGPEETRYWLLPAFLWRSYPQPLGGEDVDWWVFPVVFGGDDPDEGSYFAVLPFGGKLKGILGKDEIDIVLFPGYLHSRDAARHSTHILWPFYNEAWGGDWTGWRIWPFWGRYRSFDDDGALRYDRRFIAWPFWIRQSEQMHILPTESFFTFPFYGYRINRRVSAETILWPLYQHHHDRKYGRDLYLGYLFPFRVTDGQTDIWPFWGTKKLYRGTEVAGIVRRTYRQFALWPIQRYEWGVDGFEESTRFWLLPLFWHFHYIDLGTFRTRVESKVWPLFRYTRDGEEVAFDLLSPLWLHREEYERYYGRWFSIFRYRDGGPIGGWELFWGAAMYRHENVPPSGVFSLLGGLFEAGTRDGHAALKLLWIPIL